MHESIVFCNTCAMSSYRKFTFAISSPDEFLVLFLRAAVRAVSLVSPVPLFFFSSQCCMVCYETNKDRYKIDRLSLCDRRLRSAYRTV